MRTTRLPALAALTGAAGAVTSMLVAPDRAGLVNAGVIALVVGAYAAVGLVIMWHHPRHLVGRLMVFGAAVWGVGEGLLAPAVESLRGRPDDVPVALVATLGSTLRGLGWLVLVLCIPLVFPDGRMVSAPRLARWARRTVGVTLAAFLLVQLASPGQTDLRIDEVDNPVGLPAPWAPATDAVAGLALLLGIASLGLGVSCVVARWRREDELGRQRMLWFALAFAPPTVMFVLSVWDLGAPWMFGLASLPVPVAVGVAVRQRRLYDVQLAVNRSLTYGVLWLAIAGLYAVTVGGVGAVLEARGAGWLPWVAAGVVAVCFAPLRAALQQAANRVTYGQWARPDQVLAEVGRRLGDATDVRGLVQTLADELGAGLGLATVVVEDVDGTMLGRYGDPGATQDGLALVAYGAEVGRLSWGGRDLREADRLLLADLAPQLAAVLHAGRLLRVVRDAQERQVLAKEEERRQLRRDLHDGLGPALAGLTLQVDTLRNTQVSPERLLALRDGIQATVLDVRRLVEGLRPPALDELGLVESVRQLADRIGADGGVAVEVAAAELPPLLAAVEVAAYRIAQESLTNVVRHAGADTGRVCLRAHDGHLEMVVRDDGAGGATPRRDGIGLTSMRERAEEIGGTFTVESDERGTTVTARLPLGRAEP